MLGFLDDRFGIPPAVFADYDLLKRGPSIWLLSRDTRFSTLASLQVESVGLLLLRRRGTYLKPTSAALQAFGVHARKNIVGLDHTQMKELLDSGEICGEFGASPGYVIVTAEDLIMGCALYLPGRLVSQFPRSLFIPQISNYIHSENR